MQTEDDYNTLLDAIVHKKMLEQMSLLKLSETLGINYHAAIRHYSRMLRELHTSGPVCPTCNRIKADVQDCRDVFHYL